jgi:hypothetical protein
LISAESRHSPLPQPWCLREEERGKGLQNLIEFAKAHPKGNLRVSSLKGTYEEKYENGLGNQQKRNVALQDHKCSIGGTLIEWSVILP